MRSKLATQWRTPAGDGAAAAAPWGAAVGGVSPPLQAAAAPWDVSSLDLGGREAGVPRKYSAVEGFLSSIGSVLWPGWCTRLRSRFQWRRADPPGAAARRFGKHISICTENDLDLEALSICELVSPPSPGCRKDSKRFQLCTEIPTSRREIPTRWC